MIEVRAVGRINYKTGKRRWFIEVRGGPYPRWTPASQFDDEIKDIHTSEKRAAKTADDLRTRVENIG